MLTIDQVKTVAIDAGTVLGALSAFCTALSHVPLPASWTRVSEFFARVGLATAKFSVNKRPADQVAK
jgi:hypothetical protein